MFIDMRVNPAFYEPINEDADLEELRHREFDIHRNGTAPLAHIFNQMRCAGLDKLCITGADYCAEHGRPLVSNEEIRLLVDMAPDKFIGFASVDPTAQGAAEKLERAFTDLGLKGLMLNPSRGHYYPTDERLNPLYDLCEKYDRPILFHSGLCWEPGTLAEYGRPVCFERVASRRPGLRICLGQLGWPWVQETAMLMVKYPNIYADTGALYFDNALTFFRRILTQDIPTTWIDRSLRHQIMFASANPRFEQIRMADAITRLGLRESTVELIKGRNALEFLGAGQEVV